jgi:uncharacterized protein YdcH (DUF465 family)
MISDLGYFGVEYQAGHSQLDKIFGTGSLSKRLVGSDLGRDRRLSEECYPRPYNPIEAMRGEEKRMSHVSHELHEEFPDKIAGIKALKDANAHFAPIADAYHDLNRSIHQMETDVEPADDTMLESLKKKRLSGPDRAIPADSLDKRAGYLRPVGKAECPSHFWLRISRRLLRRHLQCRPRVCATGGA